MQILSHGFSVALYFVKSKAASLLWPWRGGGQRTTKSSAYTHCFLSTPKINVGDNHRSSEAPEEEAAWRCRQAGPIVPGCCGLAEPEHRKPSLRPDDVFCYVCFSSRQPVFLHSLLTKPLSSLLCFCKSHIIRIQLHFGPGAYH